MMLSFQAREEGFIIALALIAMALQASLLIDVFAKIQVLAITHARLRVFLHRGDIGSHIANTLHATDRARVGKRVHGRVLTVLRADIRQLFYQHIAVLDGRAFGLGRTSCRVVVDEESELWKAVCGLGRNQPARAALLLADSVVDAMGVPSQSRPRCLKALAEAALLESGGGSS